MPNYYFLIGILIFLLVRSPSKISEPGRKVTKGEREREREKREKEREEKKLPLIVDT